jgi:hypothetical protein
LAKVNNQIPIQESDNPETAITPLVVMTSGMLGTLDSLMLQHIKVEQPFDFDNIRSRAVYFKHLENMRIPIENRNAAFGCSL